MPEASEIACGANMEFERGQEEVESSAGLVQPRQSQCVQGPRSIHPPPTASNLLDSDNADSVIAGANSSDGELPSVSIQGPHVELTAHRQDQEKRGFLYRITHLILRIIFLPARTPSDPPVLESPKFTLKYQVPELIRSGTSQSITITDSANLGHVAVDDYGRGYSQAAAFEECDPSFLMYRKFAWLHNRVLLHTQDELKQMEERLETLDEWEAENGDPRKLTHRRIDENSPKSPRKELLGQIKAKIAEYDELLFRLQRKQAIKTPTKRNQNSLYNLVHVSGSMSSTEADWIKQWDDLAALAHDTENGWFKGFLEDTLRAVSPKISMVCKMLSP